MKVTISSPVTKDLTEKQLYNAAVKMFKITLYTGISTHIYNDDYSISINRNNDETNSCYIDLDSLYLRTNYNLKTFKRIIKKEFNLLFNPCKDESIN